MYGINVVNVGRVAVENVDFRLRLMERYNHWDVVFLFGGNQQHRAPYLPPLAMVVHKMMHLFSIQQQIKA